MSRDHSEEALEAGALQPKKSPSPERPASAPENGNQRHPALLSADSSGAAPAEDFEEAIRRFFLEFQIAPQNANLKDYLGRLERAIILRTLEEFNGHKKAAARFLRMKYTTLNEKIKKYHINIVKIPAEGMVSRRDDRRPIRTQAADD